LGELVAPMSRRRVALALVLLLGVSMAPSAASAAEPSAEEQAIRARLTAVRDSQREVERERDAARGEAAGLGEALRADELALAAAANALARVDTELAARRQEAEQLARERDELEARLSTQREQMAALLRSAYALGRHEQLRILFAPERVGEIARLMAYHRYLERDRRNRITALARDLAALAEVARSLEAAQAALAATRAERTRELEALEAARGERAALLAEIDRRIADQTRRLQLLGKDEKSLLALIERLRDAIGDIPRLLSGSEPFASLRGRVPWPAPGALLTGFGQPLDGGRSSEGILIGAESGAPVRAVSHGRVAYADWLTGFGLIAIIDHGDGYMSLYAHNEALTSEVGDWVDAGDRIATVGASGGRASAALYFELRRNGRPLDPLPWLRRRR
jgi:septal ring factor EnvC (AmiA/AmiB activator)